ncbi:hypothetical protein KJ953_02980 [Patescibacteria group bacterium]|nr:hypothetical protein [Patescibacteria group bacterium]
MPVMQEKEPRIPTTEEQALQEVDGYIERVEKQAETKKPAGPLQPAKPSDDDLQVSDDAGNVVMQAAQQKKEIKIILPLGEEEVRNGLHHKIFDAVRWLAEWCVMIIKKYPGKVFYKQ